MQENEEMWKEENESSSPQAGTGLRGVGITPGALDTDIENVSTPDPEGEELDLGDEGNAPAETPSPLANNISAASTPEQQG